MTASTASAVQEDVDGSARRLQEVGLKPTLARVATLEALEAAHEPISFADMQRLLMHTHPALPFNTLYTALRQLEEKDVVRRLRVEGEARVRFVLADRQVSQLLMCGECGARQWVDDAAVRQAIEALCERQGAEFGPYHLNVHVRCSVCAQADTLAAVQRGRRRGR